MYFICLFYSLNLFSGVQDFVKVYIQCLRSKALDVAVNRIGKLDRLIQSYKTHRQCKVVVRKNMV